MQTCLIAQTLKGRVAQGCLSSVARALQVEGMEQCSPASGTCSAPSKVKLSWGLYLNLHGIHTASRNWLWRWTDSWVRSFLAAASNSSFEHRLRNQAWITLFDYPGKWVIKRKTLRWSRYCCWLSPNTSKSFRLVELNSIVAVDFSQTHWNLKQALNICFPKTKTSLLTLWKRMINAVHTRMC